ncbi:hypothetical protein C7212DRAFT_319630, partial [Tuber magnatum]
MGRFVWVTNFALWVSLTSLQAIFTWIMSKGGKEGCFCLNCKTRSRGFEAGKPTAESGSLNRILGRAH